MTEAYTITGTLTDGRTIILDETLAAAPGPVRLTVEPVAAPTERMSIKDFLDELRSRHAEQGHVPRSAEKINAYIRAERASWGD